ncbi:MAG: hypothetical protein MUO50_18475 [Longimicrobiales bacterium]|nr:hypothetical protein [Longimicrobiales bacterium]
MADGTVGWHFFDAESGLVPEEFSASILPGGGEGRVVALAATPFAQAEGWAALAAVAIARSWSQGALRIFLMDLGLDAPSLHRPLGLLNREGVSDAFLYGASVQRIAQPALDDAIFFASAGTATTDPAQILGHPRWNDLAGGFSEADATLLLFLPTDIPGADKILSRATDVLFLAGEGESAEDYLGQAAIKVVAILGPSGAPLEGVEEPMESTEAVDSVEAGFELEAGGAFAGWGGLSGADGPPKKAPTLDLDQSLSLAEGFIAEARRRDGEGDDGVGDDFEGEEPQEDPPYGGDLPGSLLQDPEFILEDADTLIEGFGGEELVLDGPPEEFALDRPEFGDQGILSQEVPDFGAKFADLPDAAGDTDAVQLGEDVVRGSGFISDSFSDSGSGEDAFDSPERESAEPAHTVVGDSFRADRSRPMSQRRPPPKKKLPVPAIAGAAGLVLVLAVAAVGTVKGAFDVPGFGWLHGLFGEIPYPELTLAGAQPTEPILRFSLELDLYEEGELDLALEMRNTLRQRLPHLIFYLTPLYSEGPVRYALYAGPAIDVVEAENLRAPLGAILTREDPEGWRIRETPRAFYLGERGTLTEAQDLLASAEADGILGYIIHVSYPNGVEGYEVLSGAFEGVADARGWQLTLRENGFRDVPLIERRGRPPA